MAFRAEDHVVIKDGGAYLPVAWRLAWLRHEAPASKIDTEPVEFDRDHAVFRAHVTVINASGEVVAEASGYGSEYRDRFEHFFETAETKALGRALQAAGFGTQFAGGFDEDARGETLADAPIRSISTGVGEAAATAARATFSGDREVTSGGPPPAPPDDYGFVGPDDDRAPNAHDPNLPTRTSLPAGQMPMSEGAQRFFWKLADKNNVPDGAVIAAIQSQFGFTPAGIGPAITEVLSRREGAILTNEWLKPHVGFVDVKEGAAAPMQSGGGDYL